MTTTFERAPQTSVTVAGTSLIAYSTLEYAKHQLTQSRAAYGQPFPHPMVIAPLRGHNRFVILSLPRYRQLRDREALAGTNVILAVEHREDS